MALKICSLTEALPTNLTDVRSLSRVDTLMALKVRPLTEALTTLITLVGFLSCVDSLIGLKMEIPAEVLITYITFVGFLPSVDSDGLKGLRPHIPHIYMVSLLCELFEGDHSSG